MTIERAVLEVRVEIRKIAATLLPGEQVRFYSDLMAYLEDRFISEFGKELEAKRG